MSKKNVTLKIGGEPDSNPTFIVGIGASAGGVEALTHFFEQVPADSGMAYVVILHLSPDYDSQLAQILQGVTPIPVSQVTKTVHVEANQVYVVPPDKQLQMNDGTIVVRPNARLEDRRAPVDMFLRTLAESHGPTAIAVILSGTGANGSMGLKRVKEKGGAVFVQNPREAAFNEMPRHAIATDLVDDILPVAQIPARLMTYRQGLGMVSIPEDAPQRPEDQQQALREVFTQLRVRTGHDFSNYKRSTLLRRLERRISIQNLDSLPAYSAFLREHPEETHALLKDLLISVTNFFRDGNPFSYLEQQVLPILTRRGKETLRIWVAGCATGEEAYSLAMLCAEQTMGVFDAPKVQIFATDIDEDAIATAREGLYTLNDAADVSADRLSRFFTKEGEEYRIRREIREMILFANQNVLKDPPFSKLDLVTCRNLLIYLNSVAQERVMETFHFALNPGGYLLLGLSETVDGSGDLYTTVSREHHLYQSRQVASRPYPVPESIPQFPQPRKRPSESVVELDSQPMSRLSFGDLHQQLLEQYAPPSIIINADYDILHFTPLAGRYLHFAGGELSKNLLKLIRPELRLELRTALYQSTQQQTNVEVKNLRIRLEDLTETLTLYIRPVLDEGNPAQGFILVLFEPANDGADKSAPVLIPVEPMARQLEDELIRVKAQLRSANEHHELQSEELKASNEELQAMNEELRSAAEELETSKEELQSINEELTTVNQELKVKVEEASLVSNNLQNLINSTDIATLFLDRSLRVNLFTPATRHIFNLIPSDFGRPLTDITNRLSYAHLQAHAEDVLSNLQPIEREVVTTNGRVYIMRLLPYRTAEDRISGIVMTFVDITDRKAIDEALRESEERFRAFITATSDAVYTMSADWRQMNRMEGKTFLADIRQPSRNWLLDYIPLENHVSIEAAIATKGTFELEHRIIQANGQLGWTLSRAVPMLDKKGQILEWVGTASDITERVRSAEALRESEQRLASIRPLTLLAQTEELAEIGSWDYHRQTGQFTWSSGMYRLFELPQDQPVQPDIYLDFVVDQDRSQAQQVVSYLYEGEGHFENSFRIRVGDQDKTLRIKADVVGDGDQKRVLGVDLDISEQLKAQEQIRETAENLQGVLDSSPASIALLKAVHEEQHPEHILDFRLVVGNNKLAQFLGQPLHELVGQSARQFGELLWDNATLDILRQVYYSHEAQYEEKPMPGPNQDRWLALSAMRQDDGVVLTGLDITELKQIQGQQQQWLDELDSSRQSVDTLTTLRASLNQRTELLRSVSHDLRGNFGIINGALSLLEMANSESERTQMMAMVLRNVKQATGLLTDLLDLARLETGQQQRMVASFNAGLFLTELGQSLRPIANEQELALVLSGPDTLVVENDRQLVYRMGQNLIMNALKYTHQGSVTVQWGGAEDRWWFEVLDTGPGLDQELVAHLNSNNVTRSDVTRSDVTRSDVTRSDVTRSDVTRSDVTPQRGEGIGLRIVRELAQLLEARLEVSTETGVGTRFIVSLPLRYVDSRWDV